MEEKVENIALGEQNAVGEKDKFKDTDALKRAYGELQAEFTKRCQRIKELEGAIKERENSVKELSGEEKLQIIKEYLGDIKTKKGTVVMTDGQKVSTPPKKPRTVNEAGKLAKEFIKNIKENN